MIHIENIHKVYRMGNQTVNALAGVSLTIEAGEFVAIMGPSGSGKSTLMHVLGLLDVPDTGSYQLFGKEVSQLTEDELAVLRRQAMGFVFQQFHLLARTPAWENVALPHLYSRRRLDARKKAEIHLSEVGLGDRVEHKPNELSGGEQQRVAIARALINDPRIILADEPTGNLDSKSGEEIMELLSRLNAKGMTVILVTHEETIASYGRRIIRMRDGRIQSDGRKPTEEIRPQKDTPLILQESEKSLGAFFTGLISHFHEGMKSLLANKVRAGLSMLGILIGVAAVIAMLALGRGARQAIEVRLASLGSNRLTLRPGALRVGGVSLDAGSVTRLTWEDAQSLKHTFAEVKRVAPELDGRGQVVYGDKNWSTQVLATSDEYASMTANDPVIGRFFDQEEDSKRVRVAVLGLTVVRQLFGEKDSIGEFIKINHIPFQVIGVLPEKGNIFHRDRDDIIVIPLQTGMRRLFGKDYVDEINFEVNDPSQAVPIQDKVKELMIHRHRVPASQTDPYQVRNMEDIRAALSESSRTMAWLLASIAGISLLVGGIGIMNIMLVSVTERTREIGLRKAVGARRADILSQFLIEALVVSLAGGVLGILVGCLITAVMSNLAQWATSISPDAILLASIFSAAIGIAFGIWPARKASLLSPIEALRYE